MASSLCWIPVWAIERETGETRIEYSGPCPWCGGTDRFHVWPDARHLPGIGTLGWYRCMGAKVGRRGCDRKGDGITYLSEYRGMSFREASCLLGIDPDALLAYRRAEQAGSPSLPSAVQRRARELSPADRSTLWQEQAALIARLAHRCLCSERGKDARAYLEERGLDESMIQAAQLGYSRAYARLDAVPWGLDRGMLRLPRGLVLPWYDEADRVVCLRFRRLPDDESDEAREYYGVDPRTGEIKRYRVIFGSSTEHLYREGTLHPGQDAVLFEGELDALSAAQGAAGRFAAVATGSTTWGRTAENSSRLALCRAVLVCHDADEAGDRASSYWLSQLANARRWRPLWGDASELLQAGIDLGEWLRLGFTSGNTAEQESQQDELAAVCSVCGAEVERYSPEGIASCAEHFPGSEVPPPTPMTKDRFMTIVERIAAVFPGGCTMHTDPPGYTLEEHVRRLSEEKQATYRRVMQIGMPGV